MVQEGAVTEHSGRFGSLLLGACLAFQEAPPQPGGDAVDEPAAKTFDLLLSAEPAGPLLLELESSVDAQISLEAGGKQVEQSVRSTCTRRLIDEITAPLPHFVATRRILQWNEEEDGEIKDPPLAGLTVAVTVSDDSLGLELKLQDGRRSTQLDRLLHGAAVGLYVPLLDGVSVGDTLTCTPHVFLHLLFAMEGRISEGSAEFTLAEVDEAAGSAKLTGRATAVEQVEGEIAGQATWDCELELEVDLAAKRVVSAAGTATILGTITMGAQDGAAQGAGPSMSATVRARAKASAKVTAGKKAAEAAKQPAKLRERTHRCPAGGVQLTLPSSFESRAEAPEALFAIDYDAGVLVVGVQRFERGAGKPAEAVAAAVAELAKLDPAAPKPRDVSSGLGKGKAIDLLLSGAEVTFEVYPLGTGQLLRLRIEGSKELRKRHDKALSRMRASLRAAL